MADKMELETVVSLLEDHKMLQSARRFRECYEKADFEEGKVAPYFQSIIDDTAGWMENLPSEGCGIGTIRDYQVAVLVAAQLPEVRGVLQALNGDLVQALERAYDDPWMVHAAQLERVCHRCKWYGIVVGDLLDKKTDEALEKLQKVTTGPRCDMCAVYTETVLALIAGGSAGKAVSGLLDSLTDRS